MGAHLYQTRPTASLQLKMPPLYHLPYISINISIFGIIMKNIVALHPKLAGGLKLNAVHLPCGFVQCTPDQDGSLHWKSPETAFEVII